MSGAVANLEQMCAKSKNPEACQLCISSSGVSDKLKNERCVACADSPKPFMCSMCLASELPDWIKVSVVVYAHQTWFVNFCDDFIFPYF